MPSKKTKKALKQARTSENIRGLLPVRAPLENTIEETVSGEGECGDASIVVTMPLDVKVANLSDDKPQNTTESAPKEEASNSSDLVASVSESQPLPSTKVDAANVESDAVEDYMETLLKMHEKVEISSRKHTEASVTVNVLSAELTQSKKAHDELRRREEVLTDLMSSLLESADQAVHGEETVQYKATSLLRSMREISTLEKEFEEIANEKRQHQLAMEMEVVSIVENFTAPDELAKKEMEAVEKEEKRILGELKIKVPIEGSSGTFVPSLPDPSPHDLTELRVM